MICLYFPFNEQAIDSEKKNINYYDFFGWLEFNGAEGGGGA